MSVYLVAVASAGCSIVFSESPAQGGEDPAAVDAGAPDATVLCTPRECPTLVISHYIGSSAADDFPTPKDWLQARRGDLTTRVVLATEAPTAGFNAGETVIGMNSDCSGTYVGGGNSQSPRLAMDAVSGICEAGETLEGVDSQASTSVVGYLSEGTIERGYLRAGTYSDSETLNFVRDESVTDAEHYMWLTVPDSDRHHGVHGAGAVLDGKNLVSGQFRIVKIDLAYTRLDSIEITNFYDAKRGVEVGADQVFLQHLLIHNKDTGGSAIDVSDVGGSRSPTVWVANTIVHSVGFWGIIVSGSKSVLNVANTTVYQCMRREDNPTNHGCIGAVDYGTLEVSNSVAINNLTAMTADFHVRDNGVILDASTNNAASDTTAPGNDAVPDLSANTTFEAPTASPPDLRLKAGSMLSGNGVSMNWPFDISARMDGQPRTTTWNIGAY